MSNTYSLHLLEKLHLSKLVYFNKDFNEVYSWFGGHEIKIFNYIGEEIGHSTIINNKTKADYQLTDNIEEKDVQLSIDAIVRSLYNG